MRGTLEKRRSRMKVYLITKDFKNAFGKGASPVAVVLDKAGVKKPYNAEEFTLIGAQRQIPALRAFNELAKLSVAAKKQLGLDQPAEAAMAREAEGDACTTPGMTLYVDVYRGIDGRDFPQARGVYTYEPKDDPYTTIEQFSLALTLKDHFEHKDRKGVRQEIAALSADTKAYLALRGLKPG
jgi:hypothetical protein